MPITIAKLNRYKRALEMRCMDTQDFKLGAARTQHESVTSFRSPLSVRKVRGDFRATDLMSPQLCSSLVRMWTVSWLGPSSFAAWIKRLVVAVFVVPLFARTPQGADISAGLPSLKEVLHRSYTERQLPGAQVNCYSRNLIQPPRNLSAETGL